MSLSKSRVLWGNILWKITHPRAAYHEAEYRLDKVNQVEEARKEVLTLRQRQAEWGRVAEDSEATADALRRVVSEEAHTWKLAWALMCEVNESSILEDIWLWHNKFQRVVTAHSNLPPELFGKELDVNAHTVAALLQSPVLPLILLEYPDFAEKLGKDDRYRFARFVLQHEAVPPALLGVLKTLNDPWFALEAQTHLSAEEPDIPETPNLDWLEAQIISLLRNDTLRVRCLVYELACHGVLSNDIEPIAPWRSPAVEATGELGAHPIVRGLIRELNSFTKQNPKEREISLVVWVETLLTHERSRVKAPYLEAALSHSETPQWVDACISKGWAQSRDREYAWSPHRTLSLHHRVVTRATVTALRNEAICEALHSWNSPLQSHRSNPGLFYLAARNLPDVFSGTDLNPKYDTYQHRWSKPPEHITDTSFLVRLAIAMQLDPTNRKHQAWHKQLSNDPNRYVRAAARKEIAWSKPARN